MPPRGSLLGQDSQTSAQTNKSLAAARPGEAFYITRVFISNGATAGTLQLVSDPAGTPANLGIPINLAAGQLATLNFDTSPLKVPGGKALGYTSGTVTTHGIMVFGYTAAAGS